MEGDVNPVRDLEIIGEELRLKDEETLMKALEKMEKTVGRGGDKKLKPEYVRKYTLHWFTNDVLNTQIIFIFTSVKSYIGWAVYRLQF